MGIIIIFLFKIYKTVFVNDTMMENEETPIKRYREKYSQLITHYKNLRNESIGDASFPLDSYMKESLDELGKYPFITMFEYILSKNYCLMTLMFQTIVYLRILDAQPYKDAPENRTSVQEQQYMVILATELRTNEMYVIVYINWMYLIVMYVIPFCILVALNYR